MGYISKNIAKITDPKRLSLAGQPNFFQIESLDGVEKILLTIDITVNIAPTDPVSSSQLRVLDSKSNLIYSISGTTVLNNAGGSVYYISDEKAETAENIRQALLNDKWIASMFEINVPIYFEEGNPVAENKVCLKSRDAGSSYNIRILSSDKQAFIITQTPEGGSVKYDSISGEESTACIEIDVYEDTGIAMGSDDRPFDSEKMGKHFLSLQKNYAGEALWFELNALLSKKRSYNLPPKEIETGWFGTGTIKDYRFTAKIKGKNSFPFYYSNVLYVLNGYGYPLEPIDLTPYIFDNTGVITLLSNKPRSVYLKGETEFLNFIFSDPEKGIELEENEYQIGVGCNLFDADGKHITAINEANSAIARTGLQMVNTCQFDPSPLLEQYPEAVRIELFLLRNDIAISLPLTLDILPECLHRLNRFTFLNKLGGWDSFNADAEIVVENKHTHTTFNKTLIPGMKKGNSLETIYNKEIKQTYSLETPALDLATRIWLQELAASPVILDPGGNYIIIEEFKLPLSEEKETFSMKYRITEKYNG